MAKGKEEEEGLTLLFCKWCPKDCQNLTKEERLGCLAASGFANDLPVLDRIKEAAAEALFEHDEAGWHMRGRFSFENADERVIRDYRAKASLFLEDFKKNLSKLEGENRCETST